MGLVGSLVWVHKYGKKQCRSLLWRMRAAVKKKKNNRGKQQMKFQYDPSSYALNFDDGCHEMGEKTSAFHQDCSLLAGNGAIEVFRRGAFALPPVVVISSYKEVDGDSGDESEAVEA
ncbi:Uncharacterized protein Fot_38834 [Forsythia ovata]|uniref:Uncharacterized protein n=1 Tax=Forsythia ovata TaxID=205694 RepID=A0ABD1S306_9LAMI